MFPWLSRQGVGKVQPVGQTWAPSCFCKSFIGTWLRSLVYVLSVAAFTLKGQRGSQSWQYLLSVPLEEKSADLWPTVKKVMWTMLKTQIKL